MSAAQPCRLTSLWAQLKGYGVKAVVACDPPELRPSVRRGRFKARSIWSGLKFAFVDVDRMAPKVPWCEMVEERRAEFREIVRRLIDEEPEELGDPGDVLYEIFDTLANRTPSLARLMKIAYHLGMLEAWASYGELLPEHTIPLLSELGLKTFASALPAIPHHDQHPVRARQAFMMLSAQKPSVPR